MATNLRPMRKTVPAVNSTPNGTTVFSLDDGTREVTLVNPYGKVICKLHFRTGEWAILDRYNELMDAFPKIIEPLNRISLNADGSAVDENAGWAELKKVEGNIIQRINALLDMDEAEEIFKTRSPFSSIGGEFFVEKVLTVLGQAISAQIKEEAALSEARIKKYVDDVSENGVTEDAGEPTDNA